MATHYEILGIDERAGMAAVRSAYLEQIRLAHPDRCHPEGSVAGACRAADINVAYGVLKDRLRRAHYDRHLTEKRYPSITLHRIEPVSFRAWMITTVARLLLITFVVGLLREVAPRAGSMKRALSISPRWRSIRSPGVTSGVVRKRPAIRSCNAESAKRRDDASRSSRLSSSGRPQLARR